MHVILPDKYFTVRYSKLKTSSYFTSMYSGNLIASFVLELLLTTVSALMFSHNGVGITVTPSKIGILILTIILASLFFASFSTFLVLLIIKLHAFRLQNLFNFIPLILGYLAFAIFTFTTINSSTIYYFNPYITIEILVYYGYFGGFEFANTTGHLITLNLSSDLLVLSAIAWIVALNLINFILIRKIYYASIQEGRLM